MKNIRSFKLILNKKNNIYYTGRYMGHSPYQAANKVLSELSKNNNSNEEIFFSIIETTKNSKNNIHKYIGNRILLNNPIKYKIKSKNKSIIKKYKNNLKKIKKHDYHKYN